MGVLKLIILRGNPVSPGVVLGSVYVHCPFVCDMAEAHCEDAARHQEAMRLAAALAEAGRELDAVIARFDGRDEGKIFAAHREILEDEEIVEMAGRAITDESHTAESAVAVAFEKIIQLVGGVQDAVIASRAVDFKDVRNRVLRILQGLPEKNLSSLPGPVVVVAQDLAPSDTATLDRANVLGIVTETGGATSHTAIIAGSYGIPAVLGVAGCTAALQDGQAIGLDALSGEIFAAPDAATACYLEEKRDAWLKKQRLEAQYADKPAFTADGARLQIGLNIGSTEEADSYARCDFVGLFRTEFLYMENAHAPTEEEQYAAYRRVMKQAVGKPVTLRTLDIGGDKTLPYMDFPKEDNPFLGRRALRLCLDEPGLFRTQLRAALRASALGEMWVMIPMVGSLDDITRARGVYDSVWTELAAEGSPPGPNTKFGIMVEIPAIAMLAHKAAQQVDFASVGTNDLCQYLCAVDRMNPALTSYYQSYSPAMARVLSMVAEAFGHAGKPVSVCGEMAGQPAGAVLLAGLGYQKLSMNEARMPQVKAALAGVRLLEAQALAQKALAASTQREVMELLETVLNPAPE